MDDCSREIWFPCDDDFSKGGFLQAWLYYKISLWDFILKQRAVSSKEDLNQEKSVAFTIRDEEVGIPKPKKRSKGSSPPKISVFTKIQ